MAVFSEVAESKAQFSFTERLVAIGGCSARWPQRCF